MAPQAFWFVPAKGDLLAADGAVRADWTAVAVNVDGKWLQDEVSRIHTELCVTQMTRRQPLRIVRVVMAAEVREEWLAADGAVIIREPLRCRQDVCTSAPVARAGRQFSAPRWPLPHITGRDVESCWVQRHCCHPIAATCPAVPYTAAGTLRTLQFPQQAALQSSLLQAAARTGATNTHLVSSFDAVLGSRDVHGVQGITRRAAQHFVG